MQKTKNGVDSKTKEPEIKEDQDKQLIVYKVEIRKACGAFLAQLNTIACILAVPLPVVLSDADSFLTQIQKEPETVKKE